MKIFQKVKLLFRLHAEVTRLREDLRLARERIMELKKHEGDPRLVVEKIFGRNLKWFDFKELSKDGQRKYFKDAQMILNSEVFNNVVNRIVAIQCQEQVRRYNPASDIDPARDTQMVLNGLDLLREELESVPDPDKTPDKQEKQFNPYNAI